MARAASGTTGWGLLTCLREIPPRVPAYLGYDALGSELFEAITELPGYYPTRVEHGLLQRHAEQIADLVGYERIAELGSGSAKKTRLLLAACIQRRLTCYLPIDVSREMLVASARELTTELPGLRVRGIVESVRGGSGLAARRHAGAGDGGTARKQAGQYHTRGASCVPRRDRGHPAASRCASWILNWSYDVVTH
jgi:uncharacterized SAM-dependent methyltransferase